jgi:hypothetical protein
VATYRNTTKRQISEGAPNSPFMSPQQRFHTIVAVPLLREGTRLSAELGLHSPVLACAAQLGSKSGSRNVPRPAGMNDGPGLATSTLLTMGWLGGAGD